MLDQAVGDVDPEAVGAGVEPEPQHVEELVPDLPVGPVEVRLTGVEQVQVPLAGPPVGLGDPSPGGPAEDRLPVVRGQVTTRAAAGPEDVAASLGRSRAGGQRGGEPRVLIGGVVGDDVEDHPESDRVRFLDQPPGVVEGAEGRVDVPEVRHVVPAVDLRGRVPGVDPQRVDAEPDQVIQPGPDPLDVADPVAVRVGERADVHLVGDGAAPPRRGRTRSGHGGRRGGHGRRPYPPPTGARRTGQGSRIPEIARAITSRWISLVPSKIV